MRCALVYDFDGTLAKGNCAEHGLLSSLGIVDVPAFWDQVRKKALENDGDEILAYLGLLAAKARENDTGELSETKLNEHGKQIPLLPGVETWFKRINRYASDNGIALSHFVISSGLDAMIQGTCISGYFHKIFACKFEYDQQSGEAIWPAQSINYTTKTQYLFRINKGIDNSWDNEAVNRFIEPT
ncbi:MAG: haloacid dehalogenase-like hydrolase, partial [Candidatus Thiodiazotropha sp.]